MTPNPYQRLNLSDIDEPELPIREHIDAARLRELADSIAQHGVIQPISVRHSGSRYQIIAGHRRYLASLLAKQTHIPAIVTDTTPDTAIVYSLHENIFRSDPTDLEYANTFAQLITKERFTVSQIATALGRAEDFIRARLRILAWPDILIAHLKQGTISLSAATELSRVTDLDELTRLLDYGAHNGITARTAASWTQTWEATRQPIDPANPSHSLQTATPPTQQMMYPCFFCQSPIQIYQLTVLRSCSRCLITMQQSGALTDPPPTQ
jgi:ParB family chromosome partitioning protein